MLKRKITARLERFFSDDGRYALLVDGARQVGKTFIIEELVMQLTQPIQHLVRLRR